MNYHDFLKNYSLSILSNVSPYFPKLAKLEKNASMFRKLQFSVKVLMGFLLLFLINS